MHKVIATIICILGGIWTAFLIVQSVRHNCFHEEVVYGVIAIIVGLIIYVALSKVSITVTDKRVYGTATWGKRVDLPFDSISAVSTSAFKGIAVATSSGAIKFKGIENFADIHKEISKLLMRRKNNFLVYNTFARSHRRADHQRIYEISFFTPHFMRSDFSCNQHAPMLK